MGTLQPLAVLIAEQLTTHLIPMYSPRGRFAFRCDWSECLPIQESLLQIALEHAQVTGVDAEALGETTVVPSS